MKKRWVLDKVQKWNEQFWVFGLWNWFFVGCKIIKHIMTLSTWPVGFNFQYTYMEMEQIWMWLFWIVRGVYTKGVLCLNLNMVVESKDFHFKYLDCLFVQLIYIFSTNIKINIRKPNIPCQLKYIRLLPNAL